MPESSTTGESPESLTKDLFQPKKEPKALRVLTVLAYVLSVSMTAILLSIYYIFIWEGRPHIGAVSSRRIGDTQFLVENNYTDTYSFRNVNSIMNLEKNDYDIKGPILNYNNSIATLNTTDNDTDEIDSNNTENATSNPYNGHSEPTNVYNINDKPTTDVNNTRDHNMV